MKADALQRKMVTEFLEKIKDWPDDAKRLLKEAIDQMMARPDRSGKRSGKKGTMDAYGAWVGPETAEELIDMIYRARTVNPEREPLD